VETIRADQRKHKDMIKQLFVGILSASCLFQVQAISISTLFNTGVDSAGTVLADGTIGDPHYNLISVPGGTTDIRARRAVGGFPIPPYIGDNTTSDWIGPNNTASVDGPTGTYVYRTTFDLTGLNALTASITGRWSTDNDGIQILLNGVDTGIPPTSFTQFSSGFVSFTILSGFLPGLNTLDFYINNGGGPTALRVEMSGTASAVPDSGSTILLLGGALSVFGVLRRKLS
jgi:hypothetical protein